MDNETYLRESARTVSPIFKTDTLSRAQLKSTLQDLITAAEKADHLKRHLFYGKALDKGRLGVRDGEGGGDLANDLPEGASDLLHAMLGLFSESGEMLEAFIKIVDGAAPDTVSLSEEAGDIEWYTALYYRTLGLRPETVKARNIAKLRKRFPEQFTQEDALNRNLEAERQALSESKGEGGTLI